MLVNRVVLVVAEFVAVLVALLAAPSAFARAEQPNILVIVVDDLGWAGVGFHASAMPTPNLDRLAKQSTELDRFYSYPVCSPTRAALLTGRMPRRFNIINPLNGPDPGMPAGETTIATVLRDAGYSTALIGKWHLGTASSPQKAGFEHFYGFLSASTDYFKHTAKNGRLDWQRNGTPVEEEGYSTDLLADEAVSRIKSRDAKKPFFIELALNAVHDPLSAPPELVAKHGLYKAVVAAMDAGIGRVLDALEAEKVADDTLVVFFSDNGAGGAEGGSNAPMRAGKSTVFEGGIHVPALVRWPGKVAAGAHLAQPMSVQDMLPTIASAAGVKLPESAKIDGACQWTAISSGTPQPREPFVVASFDTAVFDGDWKLIVAQDGGRMLFNLESDPSERSDVSKDNADIVARLAARAEAATKDLPAITVKREGGGGPGGGQGGRARPKR